MRKATFTFIGILALSSLRLSAADYYWVGDGGNWTDYSTHWATSSGGSTFYTSAPGASDDVFFDANSFSTSGQTINFTGGTQYVRNFDCTGSTAFNVDGPGVLRINGNFILVPGMSWSNPDIILDAASGTKTVDTQSDSIDYISFFGTGSWDLVSNLHCFIIGLYQGTVNTHGYSVKTDYAFSVSSSYTNALYLDTSSLYTGELNLSSSMTLSSANATFYVSTMLTDSLTLKHLVIRSTPYVDYNFNQIYTSANIGQVDVYDDGAFTALTGSIGAVTFFKSGLYSGHASVGKVSAYGNLSYSGVNVDTLYLGAYNTTLRINPYMNCGAGILQAASPPCNSFITMCSDYPALPASFTLDNYSSVDQFAIFDLDFTSSGYMVASNSLDLGHVTNCSFTPFSSPEDTLYWIGGKGNWSDAAHWSGTSGGTAGPCIPSPNTTVVVDSNSFSSADTIFADLLTTYCKNISVVNPAAGSRLMSSDHGNYSQLDFMIRGSIDISPDLDWEYAGKMIMVDTGFKNISVPGQVLADLSLSNSNATWNLQRSLNATSLTLERGKLLTNDSSITSANMLVYDSLLAGTSSFYCNTFGNNDTYGYIDADSLTLYATYCQLHNMNLHRLVSTANLDMTAFDCHIHAIDVPGYLVIQDRYYWPSEFDRITVGGDLYYNSDNINHRVDVSGNMQMNRSTTVDSLFMNNPGKYLMIAADSTLTVNDTLSLASSSGNEISIFSSSTGTQANLAVNTASDVCADYLILQDINNSGTAAFYAGSNSTDNGNNTNITFSDCPGPRLMAPAAPSVSLYPNPAGNTTTLNLGKFDGGELRIRIYDMQGHLVYSESKGNLDAGNYSFAISVEGFAAGLYNCQVDAGNQHEAIRLVKTE